MYISKEGNIGNKGSRWNMSNEFNIVHMSNEGNIAGKGNRGNMSN